MNIARQSPGSSSARTNIVRRSIGIALCFSPVVLLVASLVCGKASRSDRFLSLSLSLGFAVLGLLIGILNAHLSFFRPWLYRLRQGSMEGYRFVSGLPLIGTLFVAVAGVFGFGAVPTAVVGLIALTLDTCGLPWLLIATWHDVSMWDA